MFDIRVAIIYYSLTGRTRAVAQRIRELLSKSGAQVDVYELRSSRNYRSNPIRCILDVFLGRVVDFSGIDGFNLINYDLIIVGTPIWAGRITPPIKSFLIKYKDVIKSYTACYTTSNFRRSYSRKLREFMEFLGYRVIADATVVNLSLDQGIIDEFVSRIIGSIK